MPKGQYEKPEAWFTFGTAEGVDLTLTQGNAKLFADHVKAQEAAKSAREKLEAAVTPKIISAMVAHDESFSGKVPVFSYRYGPSFGFISAAGKSTGRKANKLSLKI